MDLQDKSMLRLDMEMCRRLPFDWDMNGDGAVTIGDLLSCAQYVFYLPAKLVMMLFVDNSPGTRRFFEADCATGTGFLAGAFSLVVWFIVLGGLYAMAGALAEDFRDWRAPKAKRP